jgi:hypothetical protein
VTTATRRPHQEQANKRSTGAGINMSKDFNELSIRGQMTPVKQSKFQRRKVGDKLDSFQRTTICSGEKQQIVDSGSAQWSAEFRSLGPRQHIADSPIRLVALVMEWLKDSKRTVREAAIRCLLGLGMLGISHFS